MLGFYLICFLIIILDIVEMNIFNEKKNVYIKYFILIFISISFSLAYFLKLDEINSIGKQIMLIIGDK